MRKFRWLDYAIVFVLVFGLGIINIVPPAHYAAVVASLAVSAMLVSLVVGTVTNLAFRSRKRN
ncbi:hypothetical protein BK138_21360 [Paenibacillus rhizosphaerae]|uniref:Uncharacterized protein n=2 Tax=Paenibacillus TaxID=44249 RepID=A0A1R1ELB2_9BACL|nr:MULTISPECIES: hypothetical protein [Paenibacillus]OMF52633.1 hypothetical protein BK138_21360 [Paenibacillus rhizosphaerae]UYO06068.1 hypothetical protein K2F33_09330 [Paenibacillus sp. PSB04]GIO56286.1 hypothetical protein J21TS7_46040 [Paenibacillus cineris]